jgi:hypothetical protein
MSLVLDRTPAVTRGEKVPVADTPSIYGARSSESWGPISVRIGQLARSMGEQQRRVRELLPPRMPPDSVEVALLEALLSPWARTKTVGALSIEPGEEEPWVARNRRRGYLINKRYTSGLTAAETEELEELQSDIHHHVRAVAPLSFEVLEEFEARAREMGITVPE